MFDSPIDDVVPGEPTICGWPWHGRLDIPSQVNALPTITLRNGQVIRLPIILEKAARREWHQHGTVLRFRDPRAIDPQRNTAQLAADQQRGISWRADALYAPREGVLYGQAPTSGKLQTWLYHDGARNWRVKIQGDGTLLLRSQVFVIGRKRPEILQRVVSVSYPDGRPNLSTLAVIDAMPTGNRILFAQYDESDIFGAGNPRFNQEQLGAWTCQPREFWELTLSRNTASNVISAVFRRVRDRQQTLGEQTGPGDTYFDRAAVWLSVRINGSETLTTYHGTSQPIPDPGIPSGSIFSWDSRTSELAVNNIVGLYYENGAIKELRVEYKTEATHLEAFSGSFSVSQEGTWNSVTNEFYEGSGTLRGNLTFTNSSKISARLLRGGVQVSTAEVLASSSATRGVTVNCSIHYLGISGVTSYSTSQFSITADAMIDALKIPTRTTGVTAEGIVGYSATVQANIRDTAYINGQASIGVVRYSAQMTALALNITSLVADEEWTSALVERQYIGNCATPAGVLSGNLQTRTPPLGHLYGSWNPVTGQSIRNALNPVFWV